MIGFCTAPSRASAIATSTLSIRVGSCQVTRVPGPTPVACSPAATRSALAANSPNVIRLSPASISIGWSGVSSARCRTSSQTVGASRRFATSGDYDRMETWELLAREAIRDLVARYNANGDTGRIDQVVALFAPDAVLDVMGIPHTGHPETRGILEQAFGDMAGGSGAGP